ncbi:MAG: penicillin-binding protein [Solirubrobacteraceae bacterium]|nr:penicillin-binding protein [Solirubrobacteraceae bacterium]
MLVAAALVAGGLIWRARTQARADRRAAAVAFARAWERGDERAMWRALTPGARAAHPLAAFTADYRTAAETAGVRTVRTGPIGTEHGGGVSFAAGVTLRDFGPLRGRITLPLSGSGDKAGVDWQPALRLPGLRPGEAVRKRAGRPPQRASILAADGSTLDATGLGASIAGVAQPAPTGLQRVYDDRLAGHPSESLVFGSRVIARTRAVHGRSLHTTLRPGLMQAAAAALGSKLGGVAVVRPRDGAVQALAGLAISAPQPPGSTFKIITLSAALEHRVATPSTAFAQATFATLSGVKLGNAGGERCGGTLTQAFVESCNSVFAPLGAKVGARRLVQTAAAFGFGERPRIPAEKPSTISPVSGLRDDLAVGAAAIGQDRDLATPLEMATVGATIATGGRRARPRIATVDAVVRHRAISAATARKVRAMMLEVVRSGTGTAAAIAGVQVAGKTGTAELRPNSKDPKDADAWFVAFAPAQRPRVAVAVMLVGAGFGGKAAAPIARTVLAAALQGGV